MFQVCRPTGRLFYWVLAVAVVTASSTLVSAREGASAGKPTPQGGPALTSVIDTVYMANGSPAQGVLVITWPAFVAANGTAVAPGSLNVTLGTNGALDVALTPNAGATPANTYYTGGVPAATQRSANGVLGGADQLSRDAGRSADYAGDGNGGATGFHTVREHGAGGEGE
jgi:hypothetical protein